MKRYFKFKFGYIYYCFDLKIGIIERYIIHNCNIIKSDTLLSLKVLSENWFLNHYQEISEIEFNSIFEL